MSQSEKRSDGLIAAGLLITISAIFVVHPWFLPSHSGNFLLGLPTWYWIEMGIMVVLYTLYYVFTTKMDALYEVMGVHE